MNGQTHHVCQKNRKQRGFTLVELLVVIAIIGVLVALLLPAVQAAREAARRAQCTNHLKQIGIAMQNYHDARTELPHGSIWAIPRHTLPENTFQGTWAAAILPYMEQQAIYDLFDFSKQMNLPVNAEAVQQFIPGYVCPTDPLSATPILENRWRSNPPTRHGDASPQMGLWYPASMGPTQPDACVFCPDQVPSESNWCCQGANFGTAIGHPLEGWFAGIMGRYPKSISFKDITDGLSNTFLTGETLPEHCVYNGAHSDNFTTYPTNIPLNFMEDDNDVPDAVYYRTCGFKSLHPGGVNFAMCDGSVHFVNEAIDLQIFAGLGTRAGNETVSLP